MRDIHKESEEMFRQYNITMAQFAVLEALLHKGDMTIGALIQTVLSTSGNMTVVIRNLEHRGYIKRSIHANLSRVFNRTG